MPTAFVGQNGATLNQDTHIEVNGCSDTLSIISHSISKRTLKVSVYAPGAGEVKVSGAGLTSATKGCSAKEAVSFTLRQKKAGNLSTKLKIVFTPSKGTRQSKALELKFRLFLRCNLDRCAVLGLRSPPFTSTSCTSLPSERALSAVFSLMTPRCGTACLLAFVAGRNSGRRGRV